MRGEAPAEKTQVWVGYDDEALYFAFRCLDSQPERIRTTISRRDNAFSDDWVGVSLDSTRAGQLAFHLFITPRGIQKDALQSGSGGEDFAPDFVWQSAGHVGADGWSAEIRMPLENIRFRSGSDVRMGMLVSRWNDTRAGGDFGVSVKYGLTSAITLDATYNPDFSQVESDQFEVEINQRFPTFFSEKRPFFMEGLGLFNIAGTGGDSTMRTAVHTRKIVDPSAGLRLTGTAGRYTFGVLSS